MTDHDPDRDLWDEFDKLKPAGPDRVKGYPGGEPAGFGFGMGVRSASVALAFAAFTRLANQARNRRSSQ